MRFPSFKLKRPKQMTMTQAAKHQALMAAYQQQAQLSQQQQLAMQQAIYTTSTTNTWVSIPVGTVTTTSVGNSIMNGLYSSQGTHNPMNAALVRDTLRLLGECEIADGEPCRVKLPDGGVLWVDQDGSYRIEDKDAKVTYRANRVRDFNSYINASDKLEGFIKYCGAQGVRQDEMLNIPIKLFIGWLILQAAMADGENPEPDNLLEDLRDHVNRRCRCGRFLPRKLIERKVTFCRPVCLERELLEAA